MTGAVDVLSPADQEGTQAVLLRWLKKPGDAVERNEPLLELETDKVTVEVPAPSSGQLIEVLKNENDAVEPGMVLARISPTASVGAGAAPGKADPVVSSDAPLSPAVRRLLAEHHLQAAQVPASGKGGRLTARDIERHLNQRGREAETKSDETQAGRFVPHTQMRRRIAAHMAESVATAPHVTTVFEADLSRVVAHRAKNLQAFEARGVKLTYTAYFVAAAVKALQAVPEVNSRFHQDSLEIFSDCNIGVATALGKEGLIVPVLHRAQTLDLFGIAQCLSERVNAARENKLGPDAVRGGTFTISNHGVSGSLLAAPIVINRPQVAILGVGKLERRVVVEDLDGSDAIRVKPMCYLTLTIDHRALDAFQANAFLTAVVNTLQAWP